MPRPDANPPAAEPPLVVRPGREAVWVRGVLLMIAVGLVAVFATARRIDPYDADGSPKTHGTHTQLGMEPCSFLVATGKPCPACGMTTSFALLVRGDVGAALGANWAGTALAATWAAVLAWALASLCVGRVLLIPPDKRELALTVAVGAFLVVTLGRWVGVLVSDR